MKAMAGFFAIITSMWLIFPAQAAPVPKSAATPKPKKPNVEILVSKNKKNRMVDYDDVEQDMLFTVKIRNKDPKQGYSNMVAVVYVFGKIIDTKKFVLLGKEEAEIAVEPKGEQEFSTDQISIQSDMEGSVRYGIKYEGYAAILKDDKDNILLSKATKDSFIKNLKALDEINVGEVFTTQQLK